MAACCPLGAMPNCGEIQRQVLVSSGMSGTQHHSGSPCSDESRLLNAQPRYQTQTSIPWLQDDFDILPEDERSLEVKDKPEVQVRVRVPVMCGDAKKVAAGCVGVCDAALILSSKLPSLSAFQF